jgi:hypothetical protein
MRKHWRYLKYVARHKWFVLLAGRERGVGLWQLLVHDWSKFLPDEWGPYAEWFYGYDGGSWYAAKAMVEKEGGWWSGDFRADIEERKFAFDEAWLRHQHRNPHHWQHWVLREDSGKEKVLLMPEKYRREMLADWMGAGMAINGHGLDQALAETRAWYEKTTDGRRLHLATRTLVEGDLGYFDGLAA